MTRRTTKATKAKAEAETEAPDTTEELADLDARPEANEGNESAMSGRENPDA